MGPKIYGEFPEGRIEEYIDDAEVAAGRGTPRESRYCVCLCADGWWGSSSMGCLVCSCYYVRVGYQGLTNPSVCIIGMMAETPFIPHIARTLAAFHRAEVSHLSPEPVLWDRMNQWLGKVKQMWRHSERAVRKLQAHADAEVFDLAVLKREVAELQEALAALHSPVVFCHNDLNSGNILISNSDPSNVRFIDFEYAEYNPRGLDLANHFCEFAGTATTPNGWCAGSAIDLWMDGWMDWVSVR